MATTHCHLMLGDNNWDFNCTSKEIVALWFGPKAPKLCRPTTVRFGDGISTRSM